MYTNIVSLNYKYDKAKENVLNDLNIVIKPGRRILLCGINGAGKSTLLKLLCGKKLVYDYKEFDVMGSDRPDDGFNGITFISDNWSQEINFVGYTPYSIDMKVKNFMRLNWKKRRSL